MHAKIDDLRDLLRLEVATGKLFWMRRSPKWFRAGKRCPETACAVWNSRFADTEAFTARQSNDGYFHGRLLGKPYLAHRIVFAIHNGRWPAKEVDHINGDKGDNRPSNLREATHSQNQRNAGGRAGTSSHRGVYWIESVERWRAQSVDSSGRRQIIGQFKTEEAAALAYDAFVRVHHGEFARPNLPTQGGAVA